MFLNAAQCHSSGSASTQPPKSTLSFRHIGGAKTFSSCSAADLEQFLWQNPGCPFLRALRVYPDPRAAICGNGVVEHAEQCDCGSDVVSGVGGL